VNRLSGARSRGSASVPTLVAVFLAGSIIGAVAAVEVVPADKLPAASAGPVGTQQQQQQGTVNQGTKGTKGTKGTTTTVNGTGSTGTGTTTTGPQALPPSKFECAPGKNGGATDRGVTATDIKLATTVASSGVGGSFLGDMQYAMESVAQQVNRAGGICGRQLHITYRDDGWDAVRGAQFLRNFIKEGIFAIPVGASSEGLRVVIDGHDLDEAQIPVVGSDGLAIDQYLTDGGQAQPWVWPVATATVSSARIMANEAWRRGARNPGIVFDNNYRFGKEAAVAFNNEIKRLNHGKGVKGFNTQNTCNELYCGIVAGQNSYSGYVTSFYSAKPDFVALFLEPQTALAWMGDENAPGASSPSVPYGYGAAQPLFTQQFETLCKEKCDQMVVWTGFKPNVEKYRTDQGVERYIRDLQGTRPSADQYNQFTESAHVGMELLVEALRRVGPELTRQRLKAVLDAMSFNNQLTIQTPLGFTGGSRFANVTMQAFTMQYKSTSGGWRLGRIERDPQPGGV
jgi:ABC-type branched-subunit amino acid transport system substrate-binding protein